MGLKSQRIQESDCGLSTYLMTASNGKVQAYRWALGSVSHLRLFWNKLTLGLHAQSQVMFRTHTGLELMRRSGAT